jgi:hypothetical protein
MISQKIQKHPSKNTSSPCREQRTNPEYSKIFVRKGQILMKHI